MQVAAAQRVALRADEITRGKTDLLQGIGRPDHELAIQPFPSPPGGVPHLGLLRQIRDFAAQIRVIG